MSTKITVKKKYGRAAAGGEVPSAFAMMAKADKIGTEKFTAKKTYGGDVGLGLNSDALEMHRKKMAEKKNAVGGLKTPMNKRTARPRSKLNILDLVDGAIDSGATEEAKEKAAAEKAMVEAPILPKKKVKIKKAKKVEELPPKPEKKEKAEIIEVKKEPQSEPEKPVEEDKPKPRSATLLSTVDKAIENDAPSEVPSTSGGGVPAWKARLQAQQTDLPALKSPDAKKKTSAVPKKSKSSPMVVSKPKSASKASITQNSTKADNSEQGSSPITAKSSAGVPQSPGLVKKDLPPKSPAPKAPVKPSPIVTKSPAPQSPAPVAPTTAMNGVDAAPLAKAKTPSPAPKTTKPKKSSPKKTKALSTPHLGIAASKSPVKASIAKGNVNDSDDSSDSDDDLPKKTMTKKESPKKKKLTVTRMKSPIAKAPTIDVPSDDEDDSYMPSITTVAPPILDPSILVPSGDAKLDRLRKELEETKKKVESTTINAKIELADMTKEFTMEKETLRVTFMKDIQAHRKVNEQVDKEHQKIVEKEQAEIEELKASNTRLRATLQKLPKQMAEVTESSECLSKANEEIAGHFAELNKFAKKLQGDQNRLQESSRKCKEEYLPRYRQELWERQQHLNAETKIKNLYRDCMIKIHHRVDETNQVGLIEEVTTLVLETEGDVNPKFDPKFLSQKPKKTKSSYGLDSDSDSNSDSSSSSDSDSDSDSD
jgi:hypothetical protein